MRDLAAWARRLRPRGLPRLWLLSDPQRLPDPLRAAAALPTGAAVVARDLPGPLLKALAALARRRRLILLIAGDGRAALRHRAGLHMPDRRTTRGLLPYLAAPGRLLLSVAAHDGRGLRRARRLRADAVLLSPLFATASHPRARGLGVLRWMAFARRASCPVVALGGVAGDTAGRLPRWAGGLAAIGGLAERAVPGHP